MHWLLSINLSLELTSDWLVDHADLLDIAEGGNLTFGLRLSLSSFSVHLGSCEGSGVMLGQSIGLTTYGWVVCALLFLLGRDFFFLSTPPYTSCLQKHLG